MNPSRPTPASIVRASMFDPAAGAIAPRDVGRWSGRLADHSEPPGVEAGLPTRRTSRIVAFSLQYFLSRVQPPGSPLRYAAGIVDMASATHQCVIERHASSPHENGYVPATLGPMLRVIPGLLQNPSRSPERTARGRTRLLVLSP